MVTGIPNSAWGVRDGISERATTELRLGGGRGVGLMKELDWWPKQRAQNMQKPFRKLRKAHVADTWREKAIEAHAEAER